MLRKLIVLPFILILGLSISCVGRGFPDTLSSTAEFSLLTAEPGNDLYAAYGHSALRVRDASSDLDVVFNYGIFDFGAPNFYLNFCKGKLFYRMGASHYLSFHQMYIREQRTLYENKINLNKEQKDRIYSFLKWNYLPENQVYRYDFFFDNCATRLRDIIENQLKDVYIANSEIGSRNLSFRDALDEFQWSQPWGDFGIDMALGSVIDRKMEAREYLFHPVYMMQNLEKAELKTDSGNVLLLGARQKVIGLDPGLSEGSLFTNPIFVFWVLAVLVMILSFWGYKKNKALRVLDALLFSIFGISGWVLFLLWTATDHVSTVANYNVIWCFPLLFPLGLFLLKKQAPTWVTWFFGFFAILIILCMLSSPFIPQRFHPAFFPMMIVLLIRASLVYMRGRKHIKTTD